MPQGQVCGPGGAPKAHALGVAMYCDVDATRGIELAVKEAACVAVRADLAQVSGLGGAS